MAVEVDVMLVARLVLVLGIVVAAGICTCSAAGLI